MSKQRVIIEELKKKNSRKMVSKSQAFCKSCSLRFSSKSMLDIHTSIIHEKKNQVAVFVGLVEIGEFCKVFIVSFVTKNTWTDIDY